MTQKKQRPARAGGPPPEARSAGGRLPGGREPGVQSTARRRSEEALASLGLETGLDTAARLRGEGAGAAAERLRRWVTMDATAVGELVRSLPATRGGHGRELRIGMCGVAMVAKRAEELGFARRACKDRLCPACGERRRRMFVAALRALVPLLDLSASALRFVTQTMPKRPMEEPARALDRILKYQRRFTEGAWGRAYIVGGVRSLEVTARKTHDRVGDYEVRVPGIHAHIHALYQLRTGTGEGLRGVGRRGDRRGRRWEATWVRQKDGAWVRLTDYDARVRRAWARACEGAAVAAVDVQEVTEANVYQVGDYVVDMSGLLELLSAAPGYVRKVLAALHGRRLVAALGAWRAHDLGLRERPGTLVYGDRSVYRLATEASQLDDDVEFMDGARRTVQEVLVGMRPAPL